MKRKQVTALLIGTLATVAAMTGCGKEKSEDKAAVAAPTATPAPTQSPTPAPTATPVPVKTMGEKVQGAYEILLKNSTGKVITGVSVKSEKEEEYKSNLLMQKDSFTANEERILFYKISGKENADGQTGKQSYNVRLTFEDKTEAVLHNFPFGDMTKAEIHMEDEVVYLTYTSASTKAPVSTKAAEMMAAGEETAPTPTPEAVKNNDSGSNSDQENQTPSYNNDYNDGGSTGGGNGNTGGGNTGGGNTGGGNTGNGPVVNPGDGNNTGDGPAVNPGDDNSTGGGNTGDGPALNPGGDDNTGGGNTGGGDDNTGGGSTGGGDDNTGGGSTGGGDNNTGGGNSDGGDDGGHSDVVEQ